MASQEKDAVGSNKCHLVKHKRHSIIIHSIVNMKNDDTLMMMMMRA